ncbi:MAG TPA: DUF4395 domain-containing protein [Sulfurimonas sp.]|nr:DUF4395 domain-containing protein [Sulfurimonas sp.]
MFKYGNDVNGFKERVVNEREARAAAGILFTLGLITVMNSVMMGNGILSRIYLAFFMFDFFFRITIPNYSPSLLLGRFFVRNQKPEYVSANQKRFAWSIGFVLSVPMFYYLSWHWEPDTYKVLVCIFCLVLLFMEATLSFCLGCWVYKNILRINTENCPGGACELQFKEKVQTFNTTQKVITVLTGALIIYMSYFYFYKIENKTYFGEGLGELLMTEKQIEARDEREFQLLQDKEFGDDTF